MKIALNNQNVILKRLDPRTLYCYQCCFLRNWSLCNVLALRDHTICRTVKVLDNTELNEIFKL